MNWKLVDRVVAGAVFVYALVLYLLTVSPTASFWDAGEFIASVYNLEVMHPPGAPFYMLLGRLFSMFVPTEQVAFAVNLISVLASAGTVLLTHLTIVRLVRAWQEHPPARQPWTDRIVALSGGVIGATAFAATDSFWFNAVEAEVYALSMFFTAAVVWLVVRWRDEARAEEARLGHAGSLFSLHANRYLILIAYLFGLAIGVHLLNLLALFFVALIVFFTAYDRPEWDPATRWKGIVATGVVAALAFFVIYPGIIQLLPAAAGASGFPLFFFILVFAAAGAAVYFTQRAHKPAWNMVALCLLMVLIGYSSYAFIFIRSATDPPIDLNDPETPEAFVSYLKREQYGSTPLIKGATYDNDIGAVNLDAGSEVLFPRRWSPSPLHERVYRRYDSDLSFFLNYQVGHMYWRYFLWNFSGRESDVQDARGILVPTPVRSLDGVEQTPSERESRNVYYALPLLLGLFGMLYHLSRDWKRAFSVLILFLVTGLGIVVYLNQPPMQPRERDYSYVASFFAFALWIGIGAGGLVELARDALRTRLRGTAHRAALVGAAALTFGAVPLNLVTENYFDHDRSGRVASPDYAYNMLQSLAPNAILFTNGDNDTYPLWYLQEVEGVRRDVRVVNLSLLQTPWYIEQLKNEWARQSAPLPISATPNDLQPRIVQETLTGELAVDREAIMRDTSLTLSPEDADRIQSPMRWPIRGRRYNQNMNVLYTNDLAVYNLLETNARNGWERPVYFAVTTGQDGQLDLQDYFQLEGQAFRVIPIPFGNELGHVDPETTYERMMNFRFRNLDAPDVYYDDVIRGMLNYYRTWFAHAAQEIARQGEPDKARALLDKITSEVSFDVIPGTSQSYLLLAQAYQSLEPPLEMQSSEIDSSGVATQVLALMARAEPLLLNQLEQASTEQELAFASRYIQRIRYVYLSAGAYEQAAALSQRLATLTGDPSMAQTAAELRAIQERTDSATALPPDSLSSPPPSD